MRNYLRVQVSRLVKIKIDGHYPSRLEPRLEHDHAKYFFFGDLIEDDVAAAYAAAQRYAKRADPGRKLSRIVIYRPSIFDGPWNEWVVGVSGMHRKPEGKAA